MPGFRTSAGVNTTVESSTGQVAVSTSGRLGVVPPGQVSVVTTGVLSPLAGHASVFIVGRLIPLTGHASSLMRGMFKRLHVCRDSLPLVFRMQYVRKSRSNSADQSSEALPHVSVHHLVELRLWNKESV